MCYPVIDGLGACFKVIVAEDNLLAGKKVMFEILALAVVCAF